MFHLSLARISTICLLTIKHFIMNRIKNIVFSALLTLGAFGAVTFTACNPDECKDVVCNNGGNCVSGTCQCPTGYEGGSCETLSATKFSGTWRTNTEACTLSGSNSQYDITIAPSGTNAANLLISNLYAAGRTATATLTPGSTTNAFTIESQAFGSSGNISGSGSVTGNQMTISYTVSVGTNSDICNNVIFTKQ
jgi:hypothetical protein